MAEGEEMGSVCLKDEDVKSEYMGQLSGLDKSIHGK